MEKLEAKKVEKVLQWLEKQIDKIGKENLEGLLIAINTEDALRANTSGSVGSLEEMIVAAVNCLLDTEFYSQFPKEVALEMICFEIKKQILSQQGGVHIENQ